MFRKSTLADCKAIYDLICDLEKKELPYERFCDIYTRQVQDKHYYCLVCEEEGTVVAVMNLRMEDQLHHAETIAEILEFSVADAYRSRGVGKDMFAIGCQIAKDWGCTQMEAASNQLRTDAHRFYLREEMNNFHYKFSKRLDGEKSTVNGLGR